MQPHSKQRRGRFFIGIFLHPQGAAVHRICSPWSAGETVCDFRRFLQQSCGKCRFCTFLPKPLDKTSADFSTKFSHFSATPKILFHTLAKHATPKIPLICKVLHTFHRVFHSYASFSWFYAVENSVFPSAEKVEKRHLAKVTNFHIALQIFAHFSVFLPSRALPFLPSHPHSLCKKSDNPRKKIRFSSLQIHRNRV